MTGLDKFREDTACHAEMVRRKTAAADVIEHCVEQLEKLGYRPINEMTAEGFLALRIDPDAVDIEAPVSPSPFPDPPDTSIGEDPKAAKARSDAHVGQVAKSAAKPKRKTPSARQAFSPAQQEQIIKKTIKGESPKEIAAFLQCDAKKVANFKARNKDKIEAARQGRAAGVQTPTKPQEPAGTRPRRPAPKPAAAPAPKKQAADPGAAPPAAPKAITDWPRHLARLPRDPKWPPERDAKLVKHLIDGAGIAGAGALLGCQRDKTQARIDILTGQTGMPGPATLEALQKAIAEPYPQSQPENENV